MKAISVPSSSLLSFLPSSSSSSSSSRVAFSPPSPPSEFHSILSLRSVLLSGVLYILEWDGLAERWSGRGLHTELLLATSFAAASPEKNCQKGNRGHDRCRGREGWGANLACLRRGPVPFPSLPPLHLHLHLLRIFSGQVGLVGSLSFFSNCLRRPILVQKRDQLGAVAPN